MQSVFSLISVGGFWNWVGPKRDRVVRMVTMTVIVAGLALWSVPGWARSRAGSGTGRTVDLAQQARRQRAGRLRADILQILVKALSDKDRGVRRAAVDALGRLGPQAMDGLVTAAKSSDPVVRSKAVRALVVLWRELGRMQGSRAGRLRADILQILVKALSDKDRGVRRAAVDALGRLGPQAMDGLVTAAKSSDPVVRSKAVRALVVLWRELGRMQGRAERNGMRRFKRRKGRRVSTLSRGRGAGRSGRGKTRCVTTTQVRRACFLLGENRPGGKRSAAKSRKGGRIGGRGRRAARGDSHVVEYL